jgi:hypothetical protein
MASMLVMSSSSPKFDDMFFPRLSIIWVQIRNFDLPRETGDFHLAHVLSPSWPPNRTPVEAVYHETTPVF